MDGKEQYIDAVNAASEVIRKSSVEPEFRERAFELVLEAMLGRGSTSNLSQNASESDLPGPVSPRYVEGDGRESRFRRLAGRAGVDTDLLRSVFRVDGDSLSLVVSSKRIDPQPARGTREIALLVAGARQALGYEEWTKFTDLREVCRHYGRLDTGNFAATILRMDDAFSYSGSGQSREVRLTVPGWELWKGLVQGLAQTLAP